MRTISLDEVNAVLEVRHPGLVGDIMGHEKDSIIAAKYEEKEATIRRWRLELGIKHAKRGHQLDLSKLPVEDLEAELKRRKGQ